MESLYTLSDYMWCFWPIMLRYMSSGGNIGALGAVAVRPDILSERVMVLHTLSSLLPQTDFSWHGDSFGSWPKVICS